MYALDGGFRSGDSAGFLMVIFATEVRLEVPGIPWHYSATALDMMFDTLCLLPSLLCLMSYVLGLGTQVLRRTSTVRSAYEALAAFCVAGLLARPATGAVESLTESCEVRTRRSNFPHEDRKWVGGDR